ncbi:MAG: hypothetical protein FWD69_17385 [Polyangiaceae bacterium]|nr:hypothetical protein [Polyangiaceae bacterium]
MASVMSDTDDNVDAIFNALWARVLEAWDDERPHQAILEHAIRNEMLAELAGRYRALKDDADKGARAQKKIDGIVAAATQMMLATKTPPRTKIPWQWTASLAAVCVIVLLWLAYQVMLRR